MDERELAYDGYRDLVLGAGEDAVLVVPDYHGFTPYARAIAERHGLTITLEPVDKGASFRVGRETE